MSLAEVLGVSDELAKLGRDATRWILTAGVGALLLWAGDALRIASFIGETATFGVQAIAVSFVALGVVFLGQAVRSSRLYDVNGAGRQMKLVRARLGTPDERTGDNTAAALQYASTTLQIALIMLAFFLIHG